MNSHLKIAYLCEALYTATSLVWKGNWYNYILAVKHEEYLFKL